MRQNREAKQHPKPTRRPKFQADLSPIAPKARLPVVVLDWTEKELESLARLMNSKPVKPTEALMRALKG